MKDRADPHSREMALIVACQDPPFGVSPNEALAPVKDVLDSIGDTRRVSARLGLGYFPLLTDSRGRSTSSSTTQLATGNERCLAL
jgi:hypothetical protein